MKLEIVLAVALEHGRKRLRHRFGHISRSRFMTLHAYMLINRKIACRQMPSISATKRG